MSLWLHLWIAQLCSWIGDAAISVSGYALSIAELAQEICKDQLARAEKARVKR